MSKVVSRYKGKVYVNEANYSAGILIADVWKNNCEYKVGDILRIIHRGTKIENRIHLERVPIQDKINIMKIFMYREGKFQGTYFFSIPISPFLNIIQERYEYRPFASRHLTSSICKSFDKEIKEIMNDLQIEKYRTSSLVTEALKKLSERGYLEINRVDKFVRGKTKNYYRLLEEPIIEKTLHHLYASTHLSPKSELNTEQPIGKPLEEVRKV